MESTDNPKFLEFRKQLCGSEDSNMTKIETALNTKADNSNLVSGVLLASDWEGDYPYTQKLTVDGLTATQNGIISISNNATIEQREIARVAMLSIIEQSDNTLEIVADGVKPVQDIPVYIIILD